MTDDYEERPPNRVKHIPLKPARAGTPGEGIYLRMWQAYADENPGEWRRILRSTHRPAQRAASVAASFMVFMGCNGGASFTHIAEDYAKRNFFIGREQAFIAAWAVNNQRQVGINSGLRVSEYMLARVHPTCGAPGYNRTMWEHVPDVTQDDNDYLEGMVRWWASPEAAALRQRAQPLIDAANRMQQDAYCGRGPTNPRPEVERVARMLHGAGALA